MEEIFPGVWLLDLMDIVVFVEPQTLGEGDLLFGGNAVVEGFPGVVHLVCLVCLFFFRMKVFCWAVERGWRQKKSGFRRRIGRSRWGRKLGGTIFRRSRGLR